MGDQEWSELWGMSVEELVELWGMSKKDLAVVPFCKQLDECTINDCGCCDCRMYAALEVNLPLEDREEGMDQCRLQKIQAVTLKMQADTRIKRKEIAEIQERMALYAAKRHLLVKK